MRWQAGETRRAVFWLSTDTDAPATGLTPTVAAWKVSDGSSLSAPSVSEIGDGFYSFSFTAPTVDSYVFLVDGGGTLDNAHRYVPLEVPAGGYPDQLDAAVSSRASADALTALDAAVSALGDPAQAGDLQSVLGRLTATRAALLDNLADLDVAVSTRATPADLDLSSVEADLTALIDRLTAARAAALDLLDVAVSTRATPDDVNVAVTVNNDPTGEVS